MLSTRRTDLVGLTDYQRAKRVLSGGVAFAVIVTLLFAATAGAPINVVPVAAVGLTIVGASVAVGGLLGFLFGIPRLLQDGRSPSESDDKAVAGKSPDERRAYAGNTSLEQISDWLTKILVGVGLTQLADAPGALAHLGTFLAPGLGNLPGATIFAPALVLYCALDGFFLSYLWTRLLLPSLFAESDIRALVSSAEERGMQQGEQKAIKATTEIAERTKARAGTTAAAPSSGKALWVDDHPENNTNEMNLMSSLLGLEFVTKTSTDEALQELSTNGTEYRFVISDLSRPGDRQAGFTLLSAMKEKGFSQPFILYSASGKAELDQDARAKGAVGSTNSPSRLVELVSSIV